MTESPATLAPLPWRTAPTRNPAGAVYGTVVAGSVIAALLLGGWAWVAGRRSGLQRVELACFVLLSGAIGCLTVVLKLVFH